MGKYIILTIIQISLKEKKNAYIKERERKINWQRNGLRWWSHKLEETERQIEKERDENNQKDVAKARERERKIDW